jgi:predicted DNA-binding transcriptional regulator AlpA
MNNGADSVATTTKQNQLLTDVQVASYLAVSVGTIRRWRLCGGGPQWVRVGKTSIRYPLPDLEAYVASLPSGGGNQAGER